MERSGGMLSAALSQMVVDALSAEASRTLADAGAAVTTPFSTIAQSDWIEAVELWNRHGRAVIEELPPRKCPVCESSNGRFLFQSYDGYPFNACDACGSWYVPLMIDASTFERFFSQCALAYEVLQRSLRTRASEAALLADLERFNGYLDILTPLFPAGAKVHYLDIGCGLGNSLRAATARGLDSWGIESSVDCIRHMERSGLQLLHTAESIRAGSFDLITFWESLEHMANPSDVLCNTHRWLSDEGIVAFTVPNLNSPHVRLQRADCSIVHGGYDTPGHINLFGPQHIEKLMSRAGFDLIYLDGQYGSDLPELLSYLTGRHQGACSLLKRVETSASLNAFADRMLGAIGPVVALMERLALTTPLLLGIACKQGRRERLEARIARLRELRQAQIAANAAALVPVAHTDDGWTPFHDQATSASSTAFKGFYDLVKSRREDEIARLRAELTARGQAVSDTLLEVTKRDTLLDLSQGEINRRDELLAQRMREIDALTGQLTVLRSEVDRLGSESADIAAGLNHLLTQEREALRQRDQTILQQTARLRTLEGELSDREHRTSEQLRTLEGELLDRDHRISELRHKVQRLERACVQLTSDLRILRWVVAPLMRRGHAEGDVRSATPTDAHDRASPELRLSARCLRAFYRLVDRFRTP